MIMGNLDRTNMVLVHPSDLAKAKGVFKAEGAGNYMDLITPCVFVQRANIVMVEKGGILTSVSLEEGT